MARRPLDGSGLSEKPGIKAPGSEFGTKLFQIRDFENGVKTSREDGIQPAEDISVKESAGSFSSSRVSQLAIHQKMPFWNLLQNRN
ncbi:hypothetical protein CRV24_000814 [Beauveria bassiana]|nr:hypothetical protein CRV24_000814 [Beauveria bassiana]KAH8720627.1 hypothetical protein HC256_001015 [Beauveria bassiana]